MTILSRVFEKKRIHWFSTKNPSVSPMNCKNKLNMCVVYSIWGDKVEYLHCLYWSLLSQQKFTDIELADVKIFVSSSQCELAAKFLDPFKIDIVEMKTPFSRFNTILHPDLSGYKYIVNMDSDLFFCGRKGNLYQTINELQIKTIGMHPCERFRGPTKTMFKIHLQPSSIKKLQGLAKSMNISNKELMNRIDNTPWYLGYFYVCNLNFLQTKSWFKLSQYANSIDAGDEVTPFVYAHEYIVDIESLLLENDIKLSLGDHSIELFREECDFLKVVHPARVGKADKRLLDNIFENISKEPKPTSMEHAKYRRPIHPGRLDGFEGFQITPLQSTELTRILCLGCSFTNFRFGWPYFLAKILPLNYEVIDFGCLGAGTDLFIKISELLLSYDPDQVICQAMSPFRKIKQQKYEESLSAWLQKNMNQEKCAEIRATSWFLSRDDAFTKAAADRELEYMNLIRSLFDCPFIFMANKYDYPYDESEFGIDLNPLWNCIDLVTEFKGAEYSTYGRALRNAVWHPSVKRSKEEAEKIATLLLTQK